MSGREEVRAAIAAGLRKCRVEDGAPMRLIREADVHHISHMVAEELEALMAPARDHTADRAADLYSMAGSRVCCCDTCACSKAPENETATTKETRDGH